MTDPKYSANRKWYPIENVGILSAVKYSTPAPDLPPDAVLGQTALETWEGSEFLSDDPEYPEEVGAAIRQSILAWRRREQEAK